MTVKLAWALALVPLGLLAACRASRGDPTRGTAQPVRGGRPPAGVAQADILVDAKRIVASVSRDEIGTNLGLWYGVDAPRFRSEIASVRPRILRWPGGSLADDYDWRSQTQCDAAKHRPVTAYDPANTFERFMDRVVIPGGYDVAITVNYGSNASCTGGGDPKEAAAWVAYARSKGYDGRTKYWTVSNEEYGSWEYDLHNPPHDAATYAAAMAGPGGYYALMKAADPTARIGIVVTGSPEPNAWDSTVLRAPFDFVELHYYAQQPGQEGDAWLLERGPAELQAIIARLRAELAAAGRPDAPILLGESNSVAYSPGKQTLSIVNALYTAMTYGDVLDDGLAAGIWWFGAGGIQNCGHNDAASLYGWQDFGGYDMVAANTRSVWNGCQHGPVVPEGTIFPSGEAFLLVSRFARPGASMLTVSVDPALPAVRAYADRTKSGRYALLLLNLNETAAAQVTVGIEHSAAASYTATSLTYDKRLYDESQHNLWPGPVAASLGRLGPVAAVRLPPWSITLLKLEPHKP